MSDFASIVLIMCVDFVLPILFVLGLHKTNYLHDCLIKVRHFKVCIVNVWSGEVLSGRVCY